MNITDAEIFKRTVIPGIHGNPGASCEQKMQKEMMVIKLADMIKQGLLTKEQAYRMMRK